jgi:hypothetical protein
MARQCRVGESFSEMLVKAFKEEQVQCIDERLVRVVRIIVEQYDGDVRAFVESIRCQVEVSDETKTGNQREAAWRRL